MSVYRLYRFDRHGHIERFSELRAMSDDEAVAIAEMGRTDQEMELWFGGRKVRRWESASPNE